MKQSKKEKKRKKKSAKKNEEFRSFEEFKERFFPQTPRRMSSRTANPYTLGTILAKQSFGRVRRPKK